jgi:hypothetical protein
MPRSRRSNYVQAVRGCLIRTHKWQPAKATRFVRTNKEYLTTAFESTSPAYVTAELINKMRTFR